MTAVTLVGCGAVAQLYYSPALRELQLSGLLKVTGLFDPDPAPLTRLHQDFPAARVLTSLQDLAGVPGLAIVASPAPHHAHQTRQLLDQGLSVLCEKPMGTSLAEAQTMMQAASSARGILAIGLLRRFFPATRVIKQILETGILGQIDSFALHEGQPFRWPVASPAYFHQSNGGVLMDIGVHAIDLMLWWFGEPLELAYEDDAMGGVEVNCRLSCGFAGGMRGEIRLSRDCELNNRYFIRGSSGTLSWQVNEADRIELDLGGGPYVLDARLQQRMGQNASNNPLQAPAMPAFNFEQSFVSQLVHVIAAMNGQESLLVPASEAVRSQRIIEQCYRSGSLIKMPWLSDLETLRAAELRKAQ